MSPAAGLFANWIFWTQAAAGTLLVVGVTEALGGTTRGYRLFMAWVIAALATLVVLSDLLLPSGVPAASGEELRRPLVMGFGAGAAAYLVASLARWPRSWLAIGFAVFGLAALVVLGVSPATNGPALFAAQLVSGALALGAVTAGMLLGHWYLVTPRLSPTPLRRLIWLLIASLAAQGVLFALALIVVGIHPIQAGVAWLTWLRLLVGVLLALVAAVLALAASRAPSLQASTGLLYIGLAFVIAGSIAGTSISYITGVPV